MTVRQATVADEVALFDIVVALHRDSMARIFPYDHAKIVSAIESGTRLRGSLIGVIDAPDRDNYLAAVVRLSLDEWEWSRCLFLQQRWTYVRPEYRKSTGYFNDLMDYCEQARKRVEDGQPEGSAPIVLESSFVEYDPRKTRLMDRLWGRHGRRVGNIYFSGLPDR